MFLTNERTCACAYVRVCVCVHTSSILGLLAARSGDMTVRIHRNADFHTAQVTAGQGRGVWYDSATVYPKAGVSMEPWGGLEGDWMNCWSLPCAARHGWAGEGAEETKMR